MVEWNGGMEYWNGILEYWNGIATCAELFFSCVWCLSVQQLFRRSDQCGERRITRQHWLYCHWQWRKSLSELPNEDCTWPKAQVSSLALTSLCERLHRSLDCCPLLFANRLVSNSSQFWSFNGTIRLWLPLMLLICVVYVSRTTFIISLNRYLSLTRSVCSYVTLTWVKRIILNVSASRPREPLQLFAGYTELLGKLCLHSGCHGELWNDYRFWGDALVIY